MVLGNFATARMGDMSMALPCPCYSRVRVGAWRAVAMSRGCVGVRVSGGTRREGKGSKGARFSTLVVFASFRSLLGIKFPYFGREHEIKILS